MSVFILMTYKLSQCLISPEFHVIICRFLLVLTTWGKFHGRFNLSACETELILFPHLPALPPGTSKLETWSHPQEFPFTDPLFTINGKVLYSSICDSFHISHLHGFEPCHILTVTSLGPCSGLPTSAATFNLADLLLPPASSF